VTRGAARAICLLALAVTACGPSLAERCAATANDAREAAMASFDSADPAMLSYANIINRPARRAEVGRLAHRDTLAACRGSPVTPAEWRLE